MIARVVNKKEEQQTNEVASINAMYAPRIFSYKKYYTGKMNSVYKFTPKTHVSVSGLGDFGHGQKAILHFEDEHGNYKDALYPSLEVLGASGTSKAMKQLQNCVEVVPDVIDIILKACPHAKKDEISLVHT